MKKRLSMILTVMLLASFAGAAAARAEGGESAGHLGYVTYEVEYDVERAAELLEKMNAFRTSGTGWYYMSDGSVKQTGVLNELIMDESLTQAAMYRAAQQALYAGHNQPSGASWFEGVHPDAWMENLALGQRTSGQAFTDLCEENCDFEGQGHRRSILSTATHVGVGCVTVNGVTYWAIEYAYWEPTHEATVTMTENTVTTPMNTEYITSGTARQLRLEAETETLIIPEGESVPLPAVYEVITRAGGRNPMRAIPSDIIWESGDETVAAVDGGMVTGVGAGTAYITASALGQTARIGVTVEKAETEQPPAEEDPEPAEEPEPTETAEPEETVQPAETPTPAETVKPEETDVPVEEPIPTATPTATPDPTEAPAPTEDPEPAEEPQPAETPEPVPTATPVLTPTPVPDTETTAAPAETDGPASGTNPAGTACRHLNYTKTVTAAATCKSTGREDYVCAGCGFTWSRVTPVNPANHAGEIVDATESYDCGRTFIHRVCLACGGDLSCRLTAEGKHVGGAVTVITPATETSAGTGRQECIYCRQEMTVEIPKAEGCTHSRTETVTRREAACWQTGIEEEVCADCGKTLRSWETPKTEHDYLMDVSIVAREATCQVDGQINHPCRYFDRCRSVTLEFTPVVPHHDVRDGDEMVCTMCGRRCPAECAHEKYHDVAVSGVYCGETRTMERRCDICGAVISTWVEPPHECEKGDVPVRVEPLTCTTNGYLYYQCKHCPASFGEPDNQPTIPHVYETNSEGKEVCVMCGQEKPD